MNVKDCGYLKIEKLPRIIVIVEELADLSESRIILEEDGAEKLLGKGDMLIKWLGEKTLRAHGLNISSSDIDGLLKN